MGQKEKLIEKLKSKPKDFTFDAQSRAGIFAGRARTRLAQRIGEKSVPLSD